MDKAKVERIRKEVKRRLKEQQANRVKMPEPRYDEAYFKFVEWLNQQ